MDNMKRLLLPFLIILGIVVYAYGFQVTQVDLEELGSPTRRESLTRILRALAQPDFFEYEQEEFVVELPIQVPCPAGGSAVRPADTSGPYMVMEPACAEPEEMVTVEGFNFAPNTDGPLNFIPPSGVSLQLDTIRTDGSGHFLLTTEMRDRPSEEVQILRAVTRRNIGAPRLSQNGKDTIDKIIETVFMALLATTLGTLLAVPISFFAAQNLMRTVSTPMPSVSLSILAAPIGLLLGGMIAGRLSSLAAQISTAPLNSGIATIVALGIAFVVARYAMPASGDAVENESRRMLRSAGVILPAVIAVILAILFFSDLVIAGGNALALQLGAFDFVGRFIAILGEILRLLIVPICALIGLGLLVNIAGSVGQKMVERMTPTTGRIVNFALAALAGAVLAAILGAAVEWFYQLNRPLLTLIAPALVGTLIGLVTAARTHYDESLPVGLAIYSVTRTILNALRSIEALIMVIVFAVWVGIGPFAGVLALGLHTVASLAKLYSEQVEGIMEGPLEAVLATGANRLQMIVYAVIPQIVPPYISFTMYRWDINVRMSTIIGFAGGGGIGFLLQQNINLLNYRAASAQILAIAIVVSLMDFLSSALRQRTL